MSLLATRVQRQRRVKACEPERPMDRAERADHGQPPVQRLDAAADLQQRVDAGRIDELDVREVDPEVQRTFVERVVCGLLEPVRSDEVDLSGRGQHEALPHLRREQREMSNLIRKP